VVSRFFVRNSKEDWPILHVWSGVLLLSLLFCGLFLSASPTARVIGFSYQGESSSKGFALVNLVTTRNILTDNHYLVFDARKSSEYQMGHLPGAISFPFEAKDQALAEWAAILQPDQKIIVYCSSKKCDDALNLALYLREFGVKEIAVFTDGVEGWKNAELPLDHE
jgi:rhodanese-related sulfurtransferase